MHAEAHRSSRAWTMVSWRRPPGPPLRLERSLAQTFVMSVNLRFGSIISFASTVCMRLCRQRCLFIGCAQIATYAAFAET